MTSNDGWKSNATMVVGWGRRFRFRVMVVDVDDGFQAFAREDWRDEILTCWSDDGETWRDPDGREVRVVMD
jgi:hypothetical protein